MLDTDTAPAVADWLTRAPIVTLTPRQAQVMRWAAVGKSDAAIADILKISRKTANYHVEAVKIRYGVASRLQAILIAYNQGAI